MKNELSDAQIEKFLAGDALYGDDFNLQQIEEWFATEQEGYAELGASDSENYSYGYHALNKFHGFSRLPDVSLEHVLGYGSAYGHELLPVAARTKKITIVDPSEAFTQNTIFGIPVNYVTPTPSGDLPFETNSFDLICCFGVLHHIPNVSHVLSEFSRVLKPGGHLLLREPIVSMGDWRNPRKGLTKNERGIPNNIMRDAVVSSPLELVYTSLCDFSLTPRIFSPVKNEVYNSYLIVRFDVIISRILQWNVSYHSNSFFGKIRPASVAIVARKF